MKKGRPKKTPQEHLGMPDGPTLAECKEMLIQVYEAFGPTVAGNAVKRFGCLRLQHVKISDYSNFIRYCKSLLNPSGRNL